MVAGSNTDAPGYDLVLLAHVLTAAVGLVAVAVAGGSALALRRVLIRGGPVTEALGRYYRPGVNWVGRVLFLVPVLGMALLAMSGGEWGFADLWVSLGMGIWLAAAVAAEAVLWPTERRLQAVVTARGTAPGADGTAEGVPGPGRSVEPDPVGQCLRAGVVGLGLGAALVLTGVLMVAKP